MRLWGKVARGMLLVFAAICAVIAVVAPETRGEATLAVVIMVVVALVGVPALVRFFNSFTGDEEVLERGTPGTATVRSLTATGWRYNRQYPILRFTLDVEAAGVYPVEIKQAVDPDVLPRLAPGTIVAVRVDPSNRKKVVIDWRQPIRAAVEAAGGAQATEGAPTPAEKRSARSRSSWLFLRWLFLVFGLIFLRLGCEAGYYEAGGVRVQGVVLEKIYSPGTRATGAGRGSPSRYYVRYRFTTTEGRTLEGRADVLPGTWQKLSEGGPVEVEYLANSPDTNRIPGQRARAGVWALMALVLLGASVVLFILARRPGTPRVRTARALLILPLLVGTAATDPAQAQPIFLVTPEEANLPEAPDEAPAEPGAPLGPGRQKEALEFGPRILVIKPAEGQAVAVPLDIEVQFLPQEDTNVDLATLEVKYVKLVSIDITDRVRPYASTEGIRAERVSFPRGKHTIRISIADTRGASTSRVLTMTIQ